MCEDLVQTTHMCEVLVQSSSRMSGNGTSSSHIVGIGTNSSHCKRYWYQLFTHVRGISTTFSLPKNQVTGT